MKKESIAEGAIICITHLLHEFLTQTIITTPPIRELHQQESQAKGEIQPKDIIKLQTREKRIATYQ